MAFKKANYITLQKWFSDCSELTDIYKSDNSLTMDIEWALLQNYKLLTNVMNEYQLYEKRLEEKYGTLQSDGTRKLDTTSNTVMNLYNKELQEVRDKQRTIRIESINHKNLKGLKGVTLEIMSLFDFMID